MMKDKVFRLRLTKAQHAKLMAYAENNRTNGSDILRTSIDGLGKRKDWYTQERDWYSGA